MQFVAPRSTLNFYVAVSASKESCAGGGAKAKIRVVEASVDGKHEVHNVTVPMLTFALDVMLPHDSGQGERLGLVQTEGH